jgi:hypothetical protein
LPLPAGRYLIFAKATFAGPGNSILRCMLEAGSEVDRNRFVPGQATSWALAPVPVSFAVAGDYSAPLTVELRCEGFDGGYPSSYVSVNAIRVSAVRVDTLENSAYSGQ